MELEVSKTRMELAKARKKAVEATKWYKVFEDFTTEKARAVVDFHKSKDFFADYWAFGQETYEKGFRTRELESQNAILNHFHGIYLSFLDEVEPGDESTDATTEAPSVEPMPVILLLLPSLLQLIPLVTPSLLPLILLLGLSPPLPLSILARRLGTKPCNFYLFLQIVVAFLLPFPIAIREHCYFME